ncbi:hypothetical protein GS505_18250, partial [Rhodococcus hoagii]|nr:hypothetical protein [Prescottella equi]
MRRTTRIGSTPTGSTRRTRCWTRSRRTRARRAGHHGDRKVLHERPRHRLDLRQPRQAARVSRSGAHGLLPAADLPMATIAAVQGHAFGAGAMLAVSQDFRVMRSDAATTALPEVNLNMPFT